MLCLTTPAQAVSTLQWGPRQYYPKGVGTIPRLSNVQSSWTKLSKADILQAKQLFTSQMLPSVSGEAREHLGGSQYDGQNQRVFMNPCVGILGNKKEQRDTNRFSFLESSF